jgi:ParB-like nuclease family protein
MTITPVTSRVGDLVPNPWNPNRMDSEMFRKELASIKQFGFVNPIIARTFGEHLQIIDGEHRWRAAKEIGMTEVPVTLVDGLSDADAKQLTIVLNETRGRADADLLGALLKDLLSEGVPKADLLDVMPFGPSQFDKLTGLTDFDWSALETHRDETTSWVERTYRLPRDAAAVIDDALAAAKGEGELEDWQGLELIAADFLASMPPVGASTSATPKKERTARA